MAFTFPSSPVVDQIYSPGGGAPDYVWTGLAWIPVQVVVAPQSFRGCRVSGNGQGVLNNTVLTVAWAGEEFDTSAFWMPGLSTGIYIPAGVNYVELTTQIRWDVNAAGMRHVDIHKNATTVMAADRRQAGTTAASENDQNISTGPIPVVAGDVFRVRVSQSSGTTLGINGGSWFSIKVLG